MVVRTSAWARERLWCRWSDRRHRGAMTLPLRRLLRIAAAIAGLAVAAAAAAQPFEVSDLTRGWPLDGPIEPRDFASGGEMAVFSAETGLGREPWVTDGTLEGTRPLADSCPGQCGSGAAALTGVDGHVFFVVRQETGDDWLFRTDGTVEGTVPLDQRLSNAEWLATANGRALFLLGRYHRDDDNHIRHWLVAYGTEAVEPSLEILLTGSGTRAIESGGRLWLTDSGLWVSDGTEAGTRKVDSRRACVAMTAVAGGVACWSVGALVFSDGGELETLADLGSSEIAVESSTDDGRGRAFYVARPFPGEGDELWVTDGTVAGTRRLDAPLELGEMGGSDGRVHFAGRDAAGFEPWTTDGTPGNSRRLADLCPGPCSSSPRSFVRFGRGVVFVADGANGEPGLWFAESPRHPPHRLSTGTPFDSGDLARAVEHRGDLYVDFDRRLLRVGSDLDVHQIDFVARGAFGIAGNAVVFGNGFGLWRADGAGVTSLSRPAASFAGDALPRLAPVAHRGGLCLELSGDVWCGDVGGFALRWEGHLANAVLLSAGEVLFAVDHNVVAFTDLGTETVFDGFVHLWKSALLDGDLYFFSASRPEGLWPSGRRAAGRGGAADLLRRRAGARGVVEL